MATPTQTPWAIRIAPNGLQPSAIVGPDQTVIVNFQTAQTTSSLINGLLTQVLTTLGAQQAELNDANAKYITRTVNTFQQAQDILTKVRVMLDPSLNRVLPRDQYRKQLYQQVTEILAEMEKPL